MKVKKKLEGQFSINQILKDKIEKKIHLKKSNVEGSHLIMKQKNKWERDNPIESKMKKTWKSISSK